jgi:transposase
MNGNNAFSRDAQVEMIRVPRLARRGAMKARIQAGAQIDAIIVSAPEAVDSPLCTLNPRQRIRACAALRPGPIIDPSAATNSRAPWPAAGNPARRD